MDYLGWLLLGLIAGAFLAAIIMKRIGAGVQSAQASAVSKLLATHFLPLSLDNITISQRQFPFRVRADLQRAIDRLFSEKTRILHFCGVRREYSHEGVTLSDCVVESQHNPAVSIPPEFEELDIGEDQPIRVLKNGLWLLEQNGVKFAVLLTPTGHYGQVTGMQFQVGMVTRSSTPSNFTRGNCSCDSTRSRYQIPILLGNSGETDTAGYPFGQAAR